MFNNAYFKDVKKKSDDELLVLPTDAAVFDDDAFRWASFSLLYYVNRVVWMSQGWMSSSKWLVFHVTTNWLL